VEEEMAGKIINLHKWMRHYGKNEKAPQVGDREIREFAANVARYLELVEDIASSSGSRMRCWSGAGLAYAKSASVTCLIKDHSTRQRNDVVSIDFEALALQLLGSDVYVGLQTSEHGMVVWISDKTGRRRQDHFIEFHRADQASGSHQGAVYWVHDRVLELFPDSPYVRQHQNAVAHFGG
jgi:hypothetical protein